MRFQRLAYIVLDKLLCILYASHTKKMVGIVFRILVHSVIRPGKNPISLA